jgi:hypothetical protein
MLQVTWDRRDAARIVDALELAAEAERVRNPSLRRRYLLLMNDLGDALDRGQPEPTGWRHLDVEVRQA